MSNQTQPALVLTGKIILVEPTQQLTATFKKRQFVIETDGKYPQQVPFELAQDNCESIGNKLNLGDTVEVKFDVRGREWKSKYYVNLHAYFVRVIEAAPQAKPGPQPYADFNQRPLPPASDDEDLPF